jgi:hypothetical protein
MAMAHAYGAVQVLLDRIAGTPIRGERANLVVIDSVMSLPDNPRRLFNPLTDEQARRRRNFLQQP